MESNNYYMQQEAIFFSVLYLSFFILYRRRRLPPTVKTAQKGVEHKVVQILMDFEAKNVEMQQEWETTLGLKM